MVVWAEMKYPISGISYSLRERAGLPVGQFPVAGESLHLATGTWSPASGNRQLIAAFEFFADEVEVRSESAGMWARECFFVFMGRGCLG